MTPIKIELLELRPDFAKFRLWYYKWQETRPHQPYVDFELRKYRKGRFEVLLGMLYEKRLDGVSKEHLREIVDLLRQMGMRGVAYYEIKGRVGALYFSGRFLKSFIKTFGAPPIRDDTPPWIEHLGGFEYGIGNYVVKFRRGGKEVKRGYFATLNLPTHEDAERLASSLRAAEVKSIVIERSVLFDTESLIGLAIRAGATPPGFTQIYANDVLRVYVEEDSGHYYYFAVKHKGVWRTAWGKYVNKRLKLSINDADAAEAVWAGIVRTLARLGAYHDVKPPQPRADKYVLELYVPHLSPLLAKAAENVEARPAHVTLDGGRLRIVADGVVTSVKFEPARYYNVAYINPSLPESLRLYKALQALGIPAEITPDGVRLNGDALWTLLAIAVDGISPPAEVVPGVTLANRHSVDGRTLYTFLYENEKGVGIRFVVKNGNEWKTAGGLLQRDFVVVYDKRGIVADAINAVYRNMGVSWRIVTKDGTFVLVPRDLKLLGIRHLIVRLRLERLQKILVS